jgi:hypothetical protein
MVMPYIQLAAKQVVVPGLYQLSRWKTLPRLFVHASAHPIDAYYHQRGTQKLVFSLTPNPSSCPCDVVALRRHLNPLVSLDGFSRHQRHSLYSFLFPLSSHTLLTVDLSAAALSGATFSVP